MARTGMQQGFWPDAALPAWLPELLLPDVPLPDDLALDDLLNGFELCMLESRRVEAFAARLAARALQTRGDGPVSSDRVDSLVAEIATVTRQSQVTASKYLATASQLAGPLSATMAAFESGTLGWRHAQVITDGVEGLDPVQALELERQALLTARTGTVPQVRDRVRLLRDRLDPDGMASRHEAAMRKRPGLQVIPRRDGLIVIELVLDAVDGVAIKNRIRAQAKALKAHPGETRTVGELEGDIARDLLLADIDILPTDADLFDGTADDTSGSGAAENDASSDDANEGEPADLFGLLHDDPIEAGIDRIAHRAARRIGTRRIRDRIGVVPQVNITVPVDDAVALLPESPTGTGGTPRPPGPGWLDGYGWIDPVLTQRMLAHAPSFARILMSKQSKTVLDVGPKRLPIPADLRRWLQVRDGTCRFPGCNRTASHCEIDHSREVRHGGGTTAANLSHLCAHDHDLKDAGWQMWQDIGGIEHWLSPSGRIHTTRPAQVMGGTDPDTATSYPTDPAHRAETRRSFLRDWRTFNGLETDETDPCAF